MRAPLVDPTPLGMQAPDEDQAQQTMRAPLVDPTPPAMQAPLVDPMTPVAGPLPATDAEEQPATRPLPLMLGLVAVLLLVTGAVGWIAMRGDDGSTPSCPPDTALAQDFPAEEPPAVELAPSAAPELLPDPEAAPELLPAAEPTLTDDPAPPPKATPDPAPRRRASRHRSRRKPKAVDDMPELETETEAPPKPQPPSATALLQQAESALTKGHAKRAYDLASQSHRNGPSTAAAVVMARAACRVGDTEKAKRALKELPVLDRGAVRRDCRQNGDRIGL